MTNSKFIQYVLKIVGCMVLVMVCAIIVFTYQDFPARLMAAILGVVITATITVVLLDGQSKKEQTAKRNSKVFEEKLKIYQDFLTTLYDVVKDRKLTEEEKLQLEFKTSLVAMHCKPANLNSVSAAIRNVISSCCPSDEKKKQKSQGNIPLLESLLGVVEALKIDLYDVDAEKDRKKEDDDLKKMLFSSDIKAKTIENFQDAYVETADDDLKKMLFSSDIKAKTIENFQDAPVETSDEESESLGSWTQAIKEWQDKGWEVRALENEECPLLITRNDVKHGNISMGFYHDHYYIQAWYKGDTNFSKCLKWDNGGNRQSDMWYEFPSLSMNVPKGGFIEKFNSLPELQQYIIKRVNYLMEVIKKEHRTIMWMTALKALDGHKDWHFFTWYWTTLACESQNDDEGKVYLDTMPDEYDGSKILVKLGNRANDIELLKQTLSRIGYTEKTNDINTTENCYVTIATIDSPKPNTEDEAKMVAGTLKKLIQDISCKNRS